MKNVMLCLALCAFVAGAQGQTDNAELVNVADLLPGIVLDLRYSTVNNFLSQKMYTTDECLLARGAVEALRKVQDSLVARGLALKIFDGYRPRTVQYLMWEIYPNPIYVADPAGGSIHNRGAAVDVSLVSLATGQEVPMPTDFDYFGPEAGHGYTAGLTPEQIANRELLLDMMTRVGGFASYGSEWWHYTYGPLTGNPLLDFQMK